MKGLEEPKLGEGSQIELDIPMTAEEKQALATKIRRKMLTGEQLTPEETVYAEAMKELFGKDNDPRHPEV